MNAVRKICFATGTRADWGLMSPLAKALAARDDCNVDIIATNMHLSRRYGYTLNEIIADGFTPYKVKINTDDDSPEARVGAMAECMTGFAKIFERTRPDILVILGDRYEMLAVASAAAIMTIPIVHIAGGTVSEGAIDDSIRHAITKLSAIHLTETEDYRKRVIAMGEDPERVFNTGAIGVWNIYNSQLIDIKRLSKELSFDLSKTFAIATFHPATLDPVDPAIRCKSMLDALDRYPDIRLILTYPNNDNRSKGIINLIEEYASGNKDRVLLVKSLGLIRYLSALKYAKFTIGNSSSGIVEVASSHIPSIDIGIRQRGRSAAASVIHCGDSCDEIDAAIAKALSPEFRALAATVDNPYYKEDTLERMIDAIISANPDNLRIKKFHDFNEA